MTAQGDRSFAYRRCPIAGASHTGRAQVVVNGIIEGYRALDCHSTYPLMSFHPFNSDLTPFYIYLINKDIMPYVHPTGLVAV